VKLVPAPDHARQSRAKLGAKRVFDVVVTSVTLILLCPLLLLIAIAILVSEGRPVLYRQRRVGRYGQPFTMLKFRSMVTDAHDQLPDLQGENERTGPLFKIHKDPRVTRVGRFLRFTSLDELPQLFNVLGGTMSLVGPRPALYEERERFPLALLEREALRPGITGIWQVEARSDPDFDVYHRLDLEYVHQWSLWLDVTLLVRTPFVIGREVFRTVRDHDASTEERAPVPVVALVDPPSVHRER
jgi:lipopolysaccharide/colanic/teichoic acid biosynthesis glycosyltransferase